MAQGSGASARRTRIKVIGPDGRARNVRYSHGLAGEIVFRVGQGDPWTKISACEGMPSYRTLYDWRARYPEFAEALLVAREEAAERKAVKALEVAEGAPAGVPGDRLRVTTLMQLAALEAPQVWSAKGATAAAPPVTPEPPRIVSYARRFERVVGPDGKTTIEEVEPEYDA